MPNVMTARSAHECSKCGGQIEQGEKFVTKMVTSYTLLPVCLACAGLMRRVCAWCGKDLGVVECSVGQKGITHGICEECYEENKPRKVEEVEVET